MDLKEIKQKIKQVVFETTNIKPEDIADDASFVDDLHLDSLTMLEIAVNVDQEFDLDMPEDEMQKFTDVNTSAELVRERMAAAV
jgi:acyl carrier protein